MEKQAGEEVGAFWESRWRSGDTPWDHGQPAPPFVEFVRREGAPVGRVLIPGPGSGHDVRFFAEQGASVTGLDIAPSAVEHARRVNPHARATYQVGDVLDPAPDLIGAFDWVIEHTCLCALPPRCRTAYARAIPRYLRPGGHYLGIFYRTPHSPDGPPFGIGAEEIDDLFGDLFVLRQAMVPTMAYPSREGREELRWYQKR
jgi:hypothetical protein